MIVSPLRGNYRSSMLARRTQPTIAGALLVLPLACACAAPDPQSYWGRHFDGPTWSGALSAQTQSTERLMPALVLLGLSAGFAVVDRSSQIEAREGIFTGGSAAAGDAGAIGLGVLGAGFAVGALSAGDDGHAIEVLIESFAVVEGTSEILKHITQRERPDRSSRDSFPSGHTAAAFTMATFLARGVDDLGDGWYDKLGYLAYVPAVYVGIDRSEANRHWPSDVAFGAFLGLFLTNVVYDAHYGTAGHPGIFGLRGLSLEPEIVGEASGLALVWRF